LNGLFSREVDELANRSDGQALARLKEILWWGCGIIKKAVMRSFLYGTSELFGSELAGAKPQHY